MMFKVWALAALLSLAMAGTASAASCGGDPVQDAFCMADQAISDLVPFATHQVEVVANIVDQILPTILTPLGGWL